VRAGCVPPGPPPPPPPRRKDYRVGDTAAYYNSSLGVSAISPGHGVHTQSEPHPPPVLRISEELQTAWMQGSDYSTAPKAEVQSEHIRLLDEPQPQPQLHASSRNFSKLMLVSRSSAFDDYGSSCHSQSQGEEEDPEEEGGDMVIPEREQPYQGSVTMLSCRDLSDLGHEISKPKAKPQSKKRKFAEVTVTDEYHEHEPSEKKLKLEQNEKKKDTQKGSGAREGEELGSEELESIAADAVAMESVGAVDERTNVEIYSLSMELMEQHERGLHILSNIKLCDDEEGQIEYMQLLQREVQRIKESNRNMFDFQNQNNRRTRASDICRDNVDEKFDRKRGHIRRW